MFTCPRCEDEDIASTMSWFNTQQICTGCDKAERSHPKFAEAKKAVEDAEAAGNSNFAGVGCPPELQTK